MTDSVTPRPPCPECGYNLTGLSGGRCPECGWSIDEEVIEALESTQALMSERSFRLSTIAAAAALSVFILVGAIPLTRTAGFSWSNRFDQLAAGAAGAAAAGFIGLAAAAWRAGRFGDVERGRIRRVLRTWAAFCVTAGIVAAGEEWVRPPAGAGPTAQTSLLEFALRAVFFALPGTALFLLTTVTLESPRGRVQRAVRKLQMLSAPDDPGATFVVQAFGRYRTEQVTQEWHEVRRRTTPELEALIDRTWRAKFDEAQRSGTLLYDGELARLIACRATARTLHLTLGPGSYRDFVGTNLYNAVAAAEVGPDCLADPCGVSSNVFTHDGYLVLGRRNHRVAYHPGTLHPFGGALEAEDRAARRFDLFSAARRELCEELHIRPEDIRDLTCIGLVRDAIILQPEFLFDAVLTLTLPELLARFDPLDPKQEHERLESCYDLPEEVLPFLSRAAPLAPIAEASILLHGRHHWGEEWYESTCLVHFGEVPPQMPLVCDSGAVS